MTNEKAMKERNRFIDLCAHLYMGNGVTDSRIIRRHNNAHKQLNALCNTVCVDEEYAVAFFQDLMKNENVVVSCTAAGYALHKGICVPQALARLHQISEGPDEKAAFTASMSVLVWERGMNHTMKK